MHSEAYKTGKYIYSVPLLWVFFPHTPHISSSMVQQRNFVLVQTTEREISF